MSSYLDPETWSNEENQEKLVICLYSLLKIKNKTYNIILIDEGMYFY